MKKTVKYLTADGHIHTLPLTTDARYTSLFDKMVATAHEAGLIVVYGSRPANVLRWEIYEDSICKLSGKCGSDKLEEIDRVSKLAGLAHLDTPLA